MSEMKWVYLPEKEISFLNNSGPRDVSADVGLSPWDTPVAFGFQSDAFKKRFILVFEYLSSSEPKRRLMLGGAVEVTVGKKSNRVYKFDCDFGRLDIEIEKISDKRGKIAFSQAMTGLRRALTDLSDVVGKLNLDNDNNLHALNNISHWWDGLGDKASHLSQV